MNELQIPLAPFTCVREAEQWAVENLVKVYTDTETGGKGEISISRKDVSKYVCNNTSDKSYSRDAHFSVLRYLPEVIKRAKLLFQHPDYLKVGGTRRPENGTNPDVTIVRLQTPVNIGGKHYTVKTTLKAYHDPTRKTKAYCFEVIRS
jgi:hypothetical protein